MKIILLGASGFIGNAVLSHLLSLPSITSIIVLSRRPLSTSPTPKLQIYLISDFSAYPPDVLAACDGAVAAIWAIGTVPAWNLENARKVDIECALATADALAGSNGRDFRFVYLSGYLSEKDQGRTLWFLPSFRRLRGEAELRISTLGNERPGLETIIARPAMVLTASGGGIANAIRGLFQNVKVDALAAAMVQIAVEGNKGGHFVENEELKARGEALVK